MGPALLVNSLLDCALEAAGRGSRVFPLVPGRKTPRAALTDWETKATTDHARIERWWNSYPTDNIGLATGPTGLVVIDLDVAKLGSTPPPKWAGASGGVEVLDQLARQHGHQLEGTWTVQTASGGRHRYYQAPDRWRLRNTTGRLGWKIDTRAHGGYVVAPGSIVEGRAYTVVDDTPPAVLPAWVAELLDPPPTEPGRPLRPLGRDRGYVQTAMAAEVQRVLDAGPGRRNEALNKAAWNLARFVAAGVLPRHVVEHALQRAGEAAGYRAGPAAVAAVIRSSLNARLHTSPGGHP